MRVCVAMQLSHSKAMEIEDLLGRLSDVNDSLSSSLSGASDPRSHTLARHRDILHDYTQASPRLMCESKRPKIHTSLQSWITTWHALMQEFRRLQSALGAARDRAELFAGSSDASPMQVTHMAPHSTQGQVIFSLEHWGSHGLHVLVLVRTGLPHSCQRPCRVPDN